MLNLNFVCMWRVLDRKEPEQIIIPCKHSQQEATSPELLENVVKEHNLHNLFTSAQRGDLQLLLLVWTFLSFSLFHT